MPALWVRRLRWIAPTAWVCLSLSLALPSAAQTSTGEAGDFDYYLLSLSWSPTHCAQSDRNRNSEQCREQHDSIVHGLWPQYERGWPEFCSTGHPLRLPADLLDTYDAMTPDRGLLAYQWRKHGTCSGLAPEAYFDTAYAFWSKVTLPVVLSDPRREASFDREDLKARVSAANPGLASNMFVLTCDGRRLDEIRICLTREGRFRRCGADVLAKACRRSPMLVLPVTGR